MFQFVVLVSLVLGVHCQSLSGREYDRQLEAGGRYVFAEEEPQEAVASREGRQLQYYKTTRRTERVPSYQYSSEDNQSDQPEYRYATTESYPAYNQRDIEQILQNQQYSRLRLHKKPAVEQYLKEVTPTTKTAYNQRPAPANYLRLANHQQQQVKQSPEEQPRQHLLKQSPFQYILQPVELAQPQTSQQAKPVSQTGHYEISEASVKVLPKVSQAQVATPAPQRNFNLVAYQNALLAHQKLVETDNQDDSTRSNLYVSSNVPKKATKQQKPKPGPTDQDIEYYRQLQRYQEQKQYQEQKYQEEPQTVRYQTRLPYPKEENTVYQQQQAEEPSYEEPQYYQKPSKPQAPTPNRRPTAYKYQTEQADYPSEPIYEPKAPTVQYKHPAQLSSRQPSKYLPEPKPVRYQPSAQEEPEVKYQTIPEELLLKYQAAISQKYRQTRPQVQTTEDKESPVRYQLHYQPEPELVRYRPAGPTPTPTAAYRQNLQNSSVRYYRNLVRPTTYLE